MSNKKVDISKKGFEDLINQIVTNISEERDMALDRYRIQDEQTETLEDFMAIGKDSVAYLKLASERTNALVNIIDKIKDIVYDTPSDNEETANDGGFNDNMRKQIEAAIEQKKQKDEEDELLKGLDKK